VLSSARAKRVARWRSLFLVASMQASLIRYPVRLRKIRSAGSRVRERSFHTERETRSLKNVERARFR
jgi:hypothetical protein